MVALGRIYRHVKSGGTYAVVGHCQLEATNRPAVLYASTLGDGRTWVRDLEEFMDGRFVPVELVDLSRKADAWDLHQAEECHKMSW